MITDPDPGRPDYGQKKVDDPDIERRRNPEDAAQKVPKPQTLKPSTLNRDP
jgi:hypothetical protein